MSTQIGVKPLHLFRSSRGVNPFETTLSPATVAALEEIWTFDTPGGSITASLAIVNGAETGRPVWRVPAPVSESSPAVADGVLYVGGGDGNLYVIDAAIGASLKTLATSGTISGRLHVYGLVED